VLNSVLRGDASNDSPASLGHKAEPTELLSNIGNFHRNQRWNPGGTERNFTQDRFRDRFHPVPVRFRWGVPV